MSIKGEITWTSLLPKVAIILIIFLIILVLFAKGSAEGSHYTDIINSILY